jgi:hypothetical protein
MQWKLAHSGGLGAEFQQEGRDFGLGNCDWEAGEAAGFQGGGCATWRREWAIKEMYDAHILSGDTRHL